MRLATVAGFFFFSALAVSAQATKKKETTSELLAELTKLPTCAVCTVAIARSQFCDAANIIPGYLRDNLSTYI